MSSIDYHFTLIYIHNSNTLSGNKIIYTLADHDCPISHKSNHEGSILLGMQINVLNRVAVMSPLIIVLTPSLIKAQCHCNHAITMS